MSTAWTQVNRWEPKWTQVNRWEPMGSYVSTPPVSSWLSCSGCQSNIKAADTWTWAQVKCHNDAIVDGFPLQKNSCKRNTSHHLMWKTQRNARRLFSLPLQPSLPLSPPSLCFLLLLFWHTAPAEAEAARSPFSKKTFQSSDFSEWVHLVVSSVWRKFENAARRWKVSLLINF